VSAEEIRLLAWKRRGATWLISQLAYDARGVVQLPATKLTDRRRRVPSNLPTGPDSWRRPRRRLGHL